MIKTSSLFIGRKTELEYFQMVLAQASFSQQLVGEMARNFKSRVFLPYGIGGIGKTELAKQCLHLAQEAGWQAIAIDWDRTDCRPVEPLDLMNTIANSLRDLAGEKPITPYLDDRKRAAPVRDRVHRYRAEHPEDWQKLVGFAQAATAVMPDLQTKAIAAAAATTLHIGPQVLAKAYDLLVDQMLERKALKDTNEALLFKNANTLLARHLVKALVDIAAANRLVFLLDTGEVLPLELEEFLRDLIVCPAVEQGSGLIFIISGRYDQYREREVESQDGSRKRVKGYADRLTDPPPVAWSLSQFTDPEVADYLHANGIKTSPDLVNYVQQVTRGVPIALQLLTEAIIKLGPDRIRKDFPPKDPSEFDTSEMIILVVRRFLRYCIDRPPDENRLRALALLRNRDDAALRTVWELSSEERPRDILTDLEARYGFIQPGGILHDVVRQFLRDSLRIDDHDAAQHLSQLAINHYLPLWEAETAALPTLSQRFAENRWLDLTRDLLNALCWNNDERRAVHYLVARVLEAQLFNSSAAKGFIQQVSEFRDSPNWWGDGSKKLLNYLVQATGSDQTETMAGLNALLRDATLLELNNTHQTILHIGKSSILRTQGHTQEAFVACQNAQSFSPNDQTLRYLLAQEYLEVGEAFEAHRQMTLSTDCYSRAIELAPQYYWAYCKRGRSLAHIENYPTAFTDFAKAIELNPEEGQSYLCRGCTYRGLENYSAALADETKAIELEPNNAYGYYHRGRTYAKQGNVTTALADYSKAIELEPEHSDNYYLSRGDIYYTLKDYPAALADYSKAIELEPANSNNYISRGKVYYTLEDYPLALADCSKTIELEPANSNNYISRGNVYNALENYPAALADCSKTIELEPANSNNYISRGNVYNALENYPAALADFTKAIELKPEDGNYYHDRAHTYESQKNISAAIADFTQAIALDPTTRKYYSCRGKCYFEIDDYPAALADHTKAIELEPNNATHYNNRGITYFHLEDYPTALADYTKAIELEPNNATLYNNRGVTYFRLKDYPTALADYTKAIELEPNNATLYNDRGVTYFRLKDYPTALADYTKAIELDPKYSKPVFNTARVYALQGNLDQTIHWLHRAIKMSSKYVEQAQTETDFDSIRNTPEFKSLLKEFDQNPTNFSTA